MNLIIEIDKFWKWANKTPLEYSVNRGYGEWECDYPNWKELLLSVDIAIEQLNEEYDIELAEALIQGLAIDNESELILEKIELGLGNKIKFVEQVINSNQPQAKWQVAEFLKHVKIKGRNEFLIRLINDRDKYLKRRALISLNKVDEQKSINEAKKYTKDDDDYLRIVSLDIVEKRLKH